MSAIRNFLAVGATAIVLCMLADGSRTNCIAAEIGMTFAHAYPPNSPVGFAAMRFEEEVAKRLRSTLKVTVYPSSQLGRSEELLSQVQIGSIQLTAIPLGMASNIYAPLQVFELPFLFEDLGAVRRFQTSDTGVELLQSLSEELGASALEFWHGDVSVLAMKTTIKNPNDLSGKIIRIPYYKYLAEGFDALGSKPITIPYSEAYSAVSSGQVDGLQTTSTAFLNGKFYEILKNAILTLDVYNGYILLANTKFINSLDIKTKEILFDIFSDITEDINGYILHNLVETSKTIEDRGVKIDQFTSSDLSIIRKNMDKIWNQYGRKISEEVLLSAFTYSGAGGGGDPCKIGTCKCNDRTCSEQCCK